MIIFNYTVDNMDIDLENCWEILNDFKNNENIDQIEGLCACGSSEIFVEDTMQICSKCCAVLGRVIDNTAEWRYYGSEDNRDGDPSRCGLPTNSLLPKSSLGSMIGGTRRDNIDIKRIRMYQL